MALDKLENINKTDVKSYHKITGTNLDSVIDFHLPLVVGFIKNYTDQDFESKTRSLEIPIIRDRQQEFYLKFPPVVSVTELKEDDVAKTVNEDFILDKLTGQITKFSDASSIFHTRERDTFFWTTQPGKITVTYTGGLDLVKTQDVIIAFMEMIGINAGIKTKTYTDEEGIQRAVTLKTFPKWVWDILNLHRKEFIGC